MPLKKTLTYFILLFVLTSCKKENALDCFKSNGKDITVNRGNMPFKVLVINCKIDVTIIKGSDYKVELTAGKNVIKNIATDFLRDTLFVDNNNKCNFVRGYKRGFQLQVTVPYLKHVVNNQVGTITFAEGYSQDTLQVRAESSGDFHINGSFNQVVTSSHGNGDIYMNGSANTLYVYAKGTNYFWAEGFVVKDYAFVDTYTLGDCFINAASLQKFAYNIHSSGKIYYTGNPVEIDNVSDEPEKYVAIKKN